MRGSKSWEVEFPEYNEDLEERLLLDEDMHRDCTALGADVAELAAQAHARRQLMSACVFCFIFMIVEVVGGLMANSLAILTDAAHLLSDVASFMISLASLWLATRSPTNKYTFGYNRAEILGTLISVLLIWLITGIICYEGILRLQNPETVDGRLMFFVATAGLVVNIIMGCILYQGGHSHSHGGLPGEACGGHGGEGEGHGHSHGGHGEGSETMSTASTVKDEQHHQAEAAKTTKNINVESAYIHVIGDAIQSIGVMIAAALIWYNPEFKMADPICSILFSFLVLYTTAGLLKKIAQVLMEGIPDGVNIHEVRESLDNIPGVREVHDLHIWSLSVGKIALAVHLVADGNFQGILEKSQRMLSMKYQISHATIQIEIPGTDCHGTSMPIKDMDHDEDKSVLGLGDKSVLGLGGTTGREHLDDGESLSDNYHAFEPQGHGHHHGGGHVSGSDYY